MPAPAPAGQAIAFSRRRAAARRRQTLPDWVWGLALGVIVLGFVAAFLFLSGAVGGGGGGGCGSPLKPLGSSDISAQGFADIDASMGRVLEALSRGDKSGADAAFYGPVHNFTHNVDGPVREKNPELGKQLCAAVLKIEGDLESSNDPLELSSSAGRLRELLRQSAEALGYPRPG